MMIYLSMIESEADKDKFTRIYVSYGKLMYNIAYTILSNVQDAEDAVHEAFVDIAKSIGIIEDDNASKLKGLVTIMAERSAIDIYRKKAKRLNISLDACPEIPVEYTGGNQLAQYMAKLPRNYRNVLLLKYHHGYTNKETAKILKMSEAAVIKTDQRAKQKLKAMYAEEDLL